MSKGRFVWFDLNTPDVEAAKKFYCALFGWSAKVVPMGEMGDYTMLMLGEQGIGGMVPTHGEKAPPPHWIGYTTVDDVDAATARAKELGGGVCLPPTDIPNVGRFSVVTDPQGAVFSPFKGMGEQPEVDRPGAGMFCWSELLTSDPGKAAQFYADIFGWTHATNDMPGFGAYTVFNRAGDKMTAGAMKLPPDAPHGPVWLHYVNVSDVDAGGEKVVALGGKVVAKPPEIPGIGRIGIMCDPTGAMFALHASVATPAGQTA